MRSSHLSYCPNHPLLSILSNRDVKFKLKAAVTAKTAAAFNNNLPAAATYGAIGDFLPGPPELLRHFEMPRLP